MTAKESISALHEKYYGKGSKTQKEKAKVEKVIKEKAFDKVNEKLAEAGLPINFVSNKAPEGLHRSKEETDREIALRIAPDIKPSPKEGIRMAAGTTRAELMAQCKARGIKNYRVINKAEMEDILAHIGETSYIEKVVAGAVARWKDGWNKASREAGKDHKE